MRRMTAKQRRYFGGTRRRASSSFRAVGRRGRSRSGGKMFNIKTMLAGGLGLLAAKKVIGTNSLMGISLGDYDAGAQMIAAGAGLHFLHLDNKDLITAGTKVLVATVLDNVSSGRGLSFGMTSSIGGTTTEGI